MLLRIMVDACFLMGLLSGVVATASAQETAKPSLLQAGSPEKSAANSAIDPMASAPDFPLKGKLAEIKFGDTSALLNFKDAQTLSIVGKSGAFKDISETVSYTAIKIRPHVYMVYWYEPVSKINVVHIEDFERGIVYTNVTYPDQTFMHLKGSIKIVGNAT